MKLRFVILVFLFGIMPTVTMTAQIVDKDSLEVMADTIVCHEPDTVGVNGSEDRTDLLTILQDSIVVLQNYIRVLEEQQKQHIRHIMFADTCIVRQANNALNAPYDEKRIRSALNAFNHISSPEYIEMMSPLRQLLVDYERYYKDLTDILKRADNDRNLRNPFSGKETAENYIAEIRQTDYYLNIMQNEWVIPFMNRLTQNAIRRLEVNNPSERHIIDLKDLLNP